MATKLKNIVITKVALCSEGACSAADITLFKSKNPEGGEQMNFEEVLKQLTPEAAQAVQDELAKAKSEVPEEVATELQKTKDELEAVNNKLTEAEDKLAKSAPGAEDEEELLKSLDPAVRTLFEKQRAIAKAAEAQINKMKEAQETELAKSRAQATAGLGLPEEELTTMFKSLNSKDEELCKTVYGILEKAAKSAIDGEVFKTKGNAGDNNEGVDAYAKLEAAAAEIAKSKNITISKAMVEAMEANPDLYQAYIEQQINE